ncbi:HAD-IA family hydrolase [Plantactinospora sp. CA-294935]|uniref:HAD-IA family hydrolase n=1 Tax=Plantactinospora sp. CA-294935 TaxID=3240012 RepID=UPI003D8A98DC
MLLADGLVVQDGTRAVLLDLDGVLIDTLAMDYDLVETLLRPHADVTVPREVIRRHFPHALPDFWARVTESVGLELSGDALADLVARHEKERRLVVPVVHAGVPEMLRDARAAGLQVAVVSNNPRADVAALLSAAGLLDWVDEVVGNDEAGLRKKPAPDPYLAAAARLGCPPESCVAIEDSVLGLESASTAGCRAVGVATGAATFTELAACGYATTCYTHLGPRQLRLGREGVTNKILETPNDFVSHMVEHIAWRLGCSIELRWTSDDWVELGSALGREIARMSQLRDSSAALGMIDDGSAEVRLRTAPAEGGARFSASAQLDLDWFLSVRCEQLAHGGPLVEMLDALGRAAGLDIAVAIGGFEDPHHTWEGVYRAVGIALDRMYNPPVPEPPLADTSPAARPLAEPSGRAVERGWSVETLSEVAARLRRETAESVVTIDVRMAGEAEPGAEVTIDVADSVSVTGLAGLLDSYAKAAGLLLSVGFHASRLSSSHVVTEDVGLGLGRALRGMAVERMSEFGIYGAGSNVRDPDDVGRPVRVGLSMEGRKFWKYVPFGEDYPTFRRSFLIGHTLCGDLFSEDLDDFVDGFAGGLQASVMVHVAPGIGAEEGWPAVFPALGEATRELLSVNPYRKALAPGVKATLA